MSQADEFLRGDLTEQSFCDVVTNMEFDLKGSLVHRYTKVENKNDNNKIIVNAARLCA